MNLHIHNTYNPVTQVITTAGVDPYIWDTAASHANYYKPDATQMDIIALMISTAPDYKVGRDYMKEQLLTLGADEEEAFDNLQASFKPICAQHKLGTLAQRISELGVENNILAMIQYRLETHAARNQRALYADVWVQNELPDDKIAVMNASMTYFNNYKNFGIEGIDQGDSVDGIDDYLNGKNGLLGNGLKDQSYVPHTMTLQALVDKLTNLLMKGEY